MATYNSELSNQRLIANNFTIDTGNSSAGGFVRIENPGASINIDPSAGILTEYYGIYYIVSDVDTTVILPSSSSLIKGWSCRLILKSNTNSSLIIKNSSGSNVAVLSSTSTTSLRMIDMIFVRSSITWYSLKYISSTITRSISITGDNHESYGNYSIASSNFFSFSGAPGSTLNVNTTTFVNIPWSNTTTGYFTDGLFFRHNTLTPSIINVIRPCCVRIQAIIAINSAGGATAINQISMPNGAGAINVGTVSQIATNVYEYTFDTLNFVSNASFSIGVRKTAVSGGSNLLDQGNTCINIQILFP